MSDTTFNWWASLKHGGLLIAPAKLREFFGEPLPPLPQWMVEQLRRDLLTLRTDRSRFNFLFDTLFERVLGLTGWQRGRNVPESFSQKLITGETWRPRAVYTAPNGGLSLPLFYVQETSRVGVGKGRRDYSRTLEWLRKTENPLALLTNGVQWRLIHAGSDYDAYAEWDSEQWFEQGQPSDQVTALRHLLRVEALTGDPAPLLAAIHASRTGQAELSSELGERVRRAVELLIKACAPAINAQRTAQPDLTPQQLYIAACRVIMRCVIILFAEARELLPTDNPIYYNAYSLNGLREQLDRHTPERLVSRLGAWPRLLALFQLIGSGSTHERLPVPAYGGRLFAAGDVTANDPIRRAMVAFEQTGSGASDAVMQRILTLLTRSRVKVRQGRTTTWVDAPVDFSDLSSEYIGILYQGLLDFELRQASADQPVIFLNLGDQPALPLTRLEEMDDAAVMALVEKLQKKSKPVVSEEADDDEESEGEDEEEEEEDSADTPDDEEEADDLIATVRGQAEAWAIRAVTVGKLVNKPRGKMTAHRREQYDAAVQTMAQRLIARVILPDEWFLVRWGGTRKGSGTFYTRPQLGVPLVRRTLQPLCYEEEPSSSLSHRERSKIPLPVGGARGGFFPKLPEEILALKICDSAMGSGSLLAAALRYLTDALFESLYYHQRIAQHGDAGRVRLADGQLTNEVIDEPIPLPPDHPDFDDRLRARLKRYVVERCLYGVDLDPLAVELAKLSLWIETMDRSLPFGFLDHKLKCGNALVGCWLDRFQDYPVMAWERDGGDQKHDRFVHHFYEKTITRGKRKGQTEKSGDRWTADIKRIKSEVIKPEMQKWIEQMGYQMLMFGGLSAHQLHAEALTTFDALHNLPVHNSAERERLYREQIVNNPAYQQLKQAFDTWCAIWFWPGDALDAAPTPLTFENPSPEMAAHIAQVARSQRFFHWELEFPDVFNPQRSGFDAMIKNPPWDILKPKSQEFFTNIDPLYRTYTKQDALAYQVAYFETDAHIERDWLQYNANFRGMSNWSKNVATPFGATDGATFSFSRSKRENTRLHRMWRKQRYERLGFADKQHPFQHQGSSDLNSYKMFLEMAHAVTQDGGRIGMILPSGLYTDKGTADLRLLLLNQYKWEWLFGFINWNRIFASVYYRFKFCMVIAERGGKTTAIKSAFSRYHIEEWENAERYAVPYSREQVTGFSPNSLALLETRTQEDLRVLTKMYENGVVLGQATFNGAKVEYATDRVRHGILRIPRNGIKVPLSVTQVSKNGTWNETGVEKRNMRAVEQRRDSEKRGG